MSIFFTSDLHLGHSNCCLGFVDRTTGKPRGRPRPFATIEEMDQALIDNWNAIVGPKDEVWCLGDFAYKCDRLATPRTAEWYLRQLKGRIHLILGNHDHKYAARIADKFASVGKLEEISVNGQFFVLCHYAMRTWYKSHRGAIQLYGHSHGNLWDDPSSLSMDVGVDCHNYRPISLDEVLEFMKKKTWKPIDHHGAREEA